MVGSDRINAYDILFFRRRFKKENNTIVCYDNKLNRYYTFDEIDNYTLVSTKNTALFNKGDTLKLSYLYQYNEYYFQYMSWKGNKRDGIWKSLSTNEDSITYVEYKDDILVNQYSEKRKINENQRLDFDTKPDTTIIHKSVLEKLTPEKMNIPEHIKNPVR